ncbi:hypothetical protein [Streptomyces sp. NBC_00299]|uniref:hypothetical protein n=1 Tax=Streptomyces sp. NBC_00299 TaxID=2975705 RepID=UPI002E2A4E5E|nr:hypothetical protein [Streptomyces sp. NBC_00299]
MTSWLLASSCPRYLCSVADRHGVPLEVRICGAAVRRRAPVTPSSSCTTRRGGCHRREPVVAPDLRAPLAAALVDYAQDTQEIPNGVNGEYTHGEDEVPRRDGATIRMPARIDDLVKVLRAVSQDPAAYGDLRAAHVRQCAARLAEVPARATGARYSWPARSCAAGLGYFARGAGTDSKKVNDLQADVANDASRSVGETQKALKCTRHPTQCGQAAVGSRRATFVRLSAKGVVMVHARHEVNQAADW